MFVGALLAQEVPSSSAQSGLRRCISVKACDGPASLAVNGSVLWFPPTRRAHLGGSGGRRSVWSVEALRFDRKIPFFLLQVPQPPYIAASAQPVFVRCWKKPPWCWPIAFSYSGDGMRCTGNRGNEMNRGERHPQVITIDG
ncbi:hypothetical protein Bca101_023049 [Brassica carinata]